MNSNEKKKIAGMPKYTQDFSGSPWHSHRNPQEVNKEASKKEVAPSIEQQPIETAAAPADIVQQEAAQPLNNQVQHVATAPSPEVVNQSQGQFETTHPPYNQATQQGHHQQGYQQQGYQQQANQQQGYQHNQNQFAPMPVEANKWNWGAFAFNIWWGIGNRTYLALLCLVPFVNIVMPFVLGAKGNEWAWKADEDKNPAAFLKTQETWSRAGFWYFIIMLIFAVLYIFYIIFVFFVLLQGIDDFSNYSDYSDFIY